MTIAVNYLGGARLHTPDVLKPMRFWLFFSLGNAVLALLPVLLSRLGHREKPETRFQYVRMLYLVAILGLTVTRLAGVEFMKLIGDSIDGAGLATFLGLTLLLPICLVSALLWVLVEKLSSGQWSRQAKRTGLADQSHSDSA